MSSHIPAAAALCTRANGRSYVCREKRVLFRSNLFDLWNRKMSTSRYRLIHWLRLFFPLFFRICTRLNSAGGRTFGHFFPVFASEKSTLTMMGGARLHWTIDLWNRKSNTRVELRHDAFDSSRYLWFIFGHFPPNELMIWINILHTQQQHTHTLTHAHCNDPSFDWIWFMRQFQWLKRFKEGKLN